MSAPPVCQHERTGTQYNAARGIAFKADCGSRARCPAARRRWRSSMRERMCLVEYFRAPDLWTFTTRTADQDALYRTRRMSRRFVVPEVDAVLIDGRDRGAVTRENIGLLNTGLERVVRRITRQFERQQEPGYMQSRYAAMLRALYGTARPVRGRPGAALHIRVREAGELHGRLHAHVASDFDFLLHAWLLDTCLACGLGRPQFERRESREMHVAARFSGRGAARSATIGHYLSKYLSKSADDAPWPWPRNARLVSAGLKRKLPQRIPKPGWSWAPASVALVAVDLLGAASVDAGLHPNFPPVISRVRRLFRPLLGRVVCGFGLIFIPVFPAALHSLRAVEKLSGFGSEAGVHCTAPASSWAGQAVRAMAELP